MAVIENLPNSINYSLYFKYLFRYLEINESTICYVSIKNKRVIIYFSNIYLKNNFLSTRYINHSSFHYISEITLVMRNFKKEGFFIMRLNLNLLLDLNNLS